MGMKSRLFASAAFPLLSLTFAMQPAGAYAAVGTGAQGAVSTTVEGSYEVAQEAAPSDEELLKKRKHGQGQEQQQQEAPAEKPQREAPAEAAPEQKPQRQRQPEPQAAPEAQAPAAEEPARPRRQREAQPEQAAPEQQQAPAEEQQRPRRQRQAQPEQQAEPQAQQPQAEQPQAQPEQPKRQRDRNKQNNEQAAPEAQQPAAEAPAAAAPDAGEANQPAEKPRQRPQRQKPETAEQPAEQGTQPQGEEQGGKRPAGGGKKPAATEQQAAPAGEAPAPAEKPATAEKPAAEKPAAEKPATAEKPAATEQPAEAAPQQGQQAEQPAGQQPEQPAANAPQPGEQPAANAPQQAEQAIPAPEKVTPQELKRREDIAKNPAKSNETIVLPVENGAAVLDSDKDADRSQGRQGRRDRDRQRADSQDFQVPKSDAEAQSLNRGQQQRPPVEMEAVTREQGRRMDRRPQFDRPDGADFGQRTDDSRVIIQFGGRTVVRSDDDRRFLRDGERPDYEQLSGDRYRETIVRPEGYRIVTIRNRYGDIIQRSRVDARGRETVLYYAPELYEDPDRDYFDDPGADLPPMRLRVPLNDYIIDTSTDPDRDYYEFLSEPPVEPVERVYSLNEVKYSARIRDKVRRIDLDTVTFATGSSEIPMSQARTLRKVADAINEVLQKDQSETFLIEGHTDAVGSDQSNLILSDQRAESVANVLTDVYGIPPENLATQGYGERYLKVNTVGPNQENRRVTIRRVTPLVRPVAQNR